MIVADGFDEAIIGETRGDTEDRVVYSYTKMVGILMKQGMTGEEAVDHLEYNVLGTRLEDGPVYLEDPGEELLAHLEESLGTVYNRG